MTLTLHADRQLHSPYVMSVYVALHEKNLPFTLSRVDLAAGEQHAPAFAAASRTQRVPMLVDGDFALTESSAITEYLDEVYPGAPLYPVNRQARARVRQIQAWLRSDLAALRAARSTEVVFGAAAARPLDADARAAADKLITAASAWLDHAGEHLCGEWSIADTDLALMLHRLLAGGDAMPERLRAFATHQWRRPSVQRWLAEPRG